MNSHIGGITLTITFHKKYHLMNLRLAALCFQMKIKLINSEYISSISK